MTGVQTCALPISIKTIYIDATNADFIYNESHLKVITDALDKDLEQGQHYFSLP